MHFVDKGAGRPILMCHGNPTWSFLYRKVIPRLRDHFRCVAVDFPGFGLSDRPEGTATRLPSTPRSWASSGITCNSRSSSSWARIGVAPIGMWDAAERADRIHGMIFMNTWFWPADRLRMQVFSRVMASPPLQWAILQRNLFVEGIIPRSVTHPLSPAEMDHYRGPQPTPAARRGVAEFPRQILAARPWLQRLAERAPNVLRDKPVLLICGRNNPAFGTQDVIDRWKTCFPRRGGRADGSWSLYPGGCPGRDRRRGDQAVRVKGPGHRLGRGLPASWSGLSGPPLGSGVVQRDRADQMQSLRTSSVYSPLGSTYPPASAVVRPAVGITSPRMARQCACLPCPRSRHVRCSRCLSARPAEPPSGRDSGHLVRQT